MLNDDIREMVERISWLSPADYEILGFFKEHDIRASPNVISVNIDYDRQYVSKRCRNLLNADLLEQPEEGIYELSDLGRNFLNGSVDPKVIEEKNDE
jgi:predicted transcriptional regulator